MSYLPRFWASRGAGITVEGGGYLVNPISNSPLIHNPNATPIDFVSAAPCLVLLGEPGIGKSFSLSAEREEIEATVTAAGDLVLWIDLHEVGSDQQLNRRLVDSDVFRRWREGTAKLQLFLDSFDECRVQVSTLPAMLLGELRACPVERMVLRVACRTADWPISLEEGLRELWNDHIDIMEILPLRRVDVRQEAISQGVDGPEFLRALDEVDAVPLAIKPTTLAFLVNIYKRDGSLPKGQAQLYEEGCRMLCEESERRRDARLPQVLNEDQKLAVAGRIAALMMFGNRASIWTGSNHGDMPVDDVRLSMLRGGMEQIGPDTFVVDDVALQETLNTGLFSSRGTYRLGWAHQTYAEFLAARHVRYQRVPLTQIRNLIVHSDDPAGRLVPQLHQTIAWLASMVPEIFQEVMDREPEVLLRSDIASATAHDRKALVSSLMDLYDRGELFDRDWSLRRRYAGLAHPTIDDQLRPYILDRAKNEVVRRVAMHIAEACVATSLLDDLVHLALDEHETQLTRVAAAYAVIHLDSDEHRGQLKPLVLVAPSNDPNDELKGCGLLATWPQHLSTAELIAALTPFRGNFHGSYRSFVYHDPFDDAPVRDFSKALRWAQELILQEEVPYEFELLINSIMRRAWQYLDEPLVLSSFTEAALVRIREYGTIFGRQQGVLDDYHDRTMDNALRSDDFKRRLILREALLHVSERSELFVLSRLGLAPSQDVPWFVDQYQSAPESLQRRWAELIEASFDSQDREQVETLLVLRESDDTIRDVFSEWFDPVPLNSKQADRARKYYEAQLEYAENKESKVVSLQPPTSERIATHLMRFDEGRLEEWWQLNYQLMRGAESSAVVNEYQSDLTILPGWSAIDQLTREALVDAAERYILEQIPAPDQWITQGNIIHRPDWAGFRAFRLLLSYAPDRVSLLPPEIWSRWAEVLVVFPTLSSEEGREHQRRLVSMAYEHNPDAVIATFLLLVDPENPNVHGHSPYAIDKLAGCWDQQLEAALVDHIRTERVSIEVFKAVLDALLVRGVVSAVSLAERIIQERQGDDQCHRAAAASSLLSHAAGQSWTVVWDAISRDAEFGELVFNWLVHREDERVQVRSQLDEEQIAAFYIWVVQHYPHSEDPPLNGFVGFRQAVAMWRDGLLSELQHRGTIAACESIERIMVALPHLDWLRWTLDEAKRLTRLQTWRPPAVHDILGLMEAPERRLVQNGDDLLDVVMESLVRFQVKLQTHEPPLAPYLWNEKPISPKDEERLSDFLKSHLDDDLRGRGIIINREVTNRRGDETDIRVETFRYDLNHEVTDLITVIIEIKGNWNPHLRIAMQEQLAERYMANNLSNHGIYVVGWYTGKQWDPSDWRSNVVRRMHMSLEEAQATFDDQADTLSVMGRTLRALVLDMHLP